MRDLSRLDTHEWGTYFKSHFESMGVSDHEEYFNLCESMGFKDTLNKTKKELKQERRDFEYKKRNFVQKKVWKNKPKSMFKDIVEKLDKPSSYKEELDEFLNYLAKRTKLTSGPGYVERMVRVFSLFDVFKEKQLNSWRTWKPKSHNSVRQLSSLVRHVFCKYDVPLFMDNAWYNNDKKYDDHIVWFIELGQGKNFRKMDNLPFPITKKIAHNFLQAPNHYEVNDALYWGVVHANGGDERIANSIMETKLTNDYKKYEFVVSVIRFFIENPMLDVSQYNPIVDYIWEKKYTRRREFINRGEVNYLAPEQPNFSMNGRTPASLLNQVEHWHRQLGKETKGKDLQWEHHKDIKDFEVKYGSKEKGNVRFYKIIELVSSKELAAEGRALRHCVSTYSHSCFRGSVSIWSMTLESFEGNKNLVTIEVDRDKTIRQVRGLGNRLPNTQEILIIRKWIAKEGLSTSRYLDF